MCQPTPAMCQPTSASPVRKKRRYITMPTRQEIRRLRTKGLYIYEIAQRLNLSETTVFYHSSDIKPPARQAAAAPIEPELKAHILSLHSEGQSVTSIARALKRPCASIHSLLAREGAISPHSNRP